MARNKTRDTCCRSAAYIAGRFPPAVLAWVPPAVSTRRLSSNATPRRIYLRLRASSLPASCSNRTMTATIAATSPGYIPRQPRTVDSTAQQPRAMSKVFGQRNSGARPLPINPMLRNRSIHTPQVQSKGHQVRILNSAVHCYRFRVYRNPRSERKCPVGCVPWFNLPSRTSDPVESFRYRKGYRVAIS